MFFDKTKYNARKMLLIMSAVLLLTTISAEHHPRKPFIGRTFTEPTPPIHADLRNIDIAFITERMKTSVPANVAGLTIATWSMNRVLFKLSRIFSGGGKNTTSSNKKETPKIEVAKEKVMVKDHNSNIHPRLSVTIKIISSGFGNETYNITYVTE
tara:strand:- start:1405 stop:1869 length:465 start_codon:yes stop_codon:yes gene_type:complete